MHTFFLEPEAWRIPASGRGPANAAQGGPGSSVGTPGQRDRSEPWLLTGAEARHAANVLRIGPGDEVRCIDGRGREGVFRVLKAAKRELALEPVSLTEHARPACEAWLALGWNKAARRGWLLEKAVELRAGGLIFWQARRSQGRLPDAPKDSWAASLIAGAKQSANPFLPATDVLPGGVEALAQAGQGFDHRVLLWENEATRRLAPQRLARPGRTLFALGPEGGLEDDEAALLAQAGFEPAGLGRGVLRWETAALLALGLSWWAAPDLEHSDDSAS